MGKIVKYCAKCEESFSERFSFCPNCASEMTAYEMSPIMPEPKDPDPVIFEPADEVTVEKIETKPIETAVIEEKIEPAPPVFLSQNADDDILEFADEEIEMEEEEQITATSAAFIEEEQITATSPVSIEEEEQITATPTVSIPVEPIPVVAAPTVSSVAPTNVEDYQRTYQASTETPSFASQASKNSGYEPKPSNKQIDDDGFYNVTLVQEKGSGTRNMLLLGAAFLVMTFSVGGLIFSLFNSDAYVGSLDDDLTNIVFVGDDVPAEDPEMEKPKDEDKGGGGGGGGNKEKTETSKGVLASQSEKPQIPPSAHMDKVTNPELVLKPETQGTRKEQPTNEKYGDPNSRYDVASDGTGSGGGQGSGEGRGQGSGRGTGAGSGIGSGNGSGIGNGDGNGRGDGRGNRDDGDEPPPTPKAGPTVAMSITSKPRPNYTDAARQNQVQGTVTLRVTFNANGSIGSISPVNGLPYGLTEQAIAAARNIRFSPQLKNGVPQTVIKQVQYNFTLY